MMSTIPVATIVILINLVFSNTSVINAVKVDNQIFEHQVEPNNTDWKTKWPSFTGPSFNYILGLFSKQDNPMLMHHQTPQERAMIMSAILLSQQNNMTVNGKQFAYRLEETSGRDVIETLDRTCLSITENQILGIVGPTYSSEARTIARFCNRVGLPVIGYSTTDPELSDRNAYRTFYRMIDSDVITAQALLKLFQKYNWTSANVIYQGDNYGQGGRQALAEIFTNEIKIARAMKYDLFTDRIDNFRSRLENSSSRIVIVWANANVTTNIIHLALEARNILAPSFLWIFTALNSKMHLDDEQLKGMLLIRSATPEVFNVSTNITLLKNASDIWKYYDPESYPSDEIQIDSYALYVFDSAWMLILAFEELCRQKSIDCPSLLNTTHCFDSRLTDQTELHQILQKINFLGTSGRVEFSENTTDRLTRSGSYFIIDNLQHSLAYIDTLQAVEVLRLNGNISNSTRNSAPQWISTTHPIVWPDGSNVAPADYRTLSDKKSLNITVYVSAPFFMEEFNNITNKTDRFGYIYDLISLLEERAGFKSILTVAPNSTSYNELVECVQNSTCEIVMADLTETASRLEKVDFSVSIYDNYLRLVVRKSKRALVPWYAFVTPFHGYVWLVIGITFSVSVLLIYGYEHVEGRARSNRIEFSIYDQSTLKSFLKSFYHTIGAMVQRGSELQVRSFGGRGHTILLWLTSIYLISLLTSSMTTYFIAGQEKPWIENIDELKMCGKIGCNRIGVVERSQHYEYVTTQLMDGYEMNYFYLKHPTECYGKLLEYQIDVAIADSSSAEYFTQLKEYCQLAIVGLPFGKTDFAIALPKLWIYKQDLDGHIMKLKEEGAIDRLLAKYFQKKLCDNEDINNGNGGGLRLSQVYGLFIIQSSFAIGILIISVLKWYFVDCKPDRRSDPSNRTNTINPIIQSQHHQQGNQMQNLDVVIQTIDPNFAIDTVIHAGGERF